MSDVIYPLLVILVGGLFAPIITQLIEQAYAHSRGKAEPTAASTAGEKSSKPKKWLRFLTIATCTQLVLFTAFFFMTKWAYFDVNYFNTAERELIREGIRKDKAYIIPKMTIRIYSEAGSGVNLTNSVCDGNPINYCMLVSISYEIVALKNFKEQKIFSEYFHAVHASNVIGEPGSETENKDVNPQKQILTYDILTTMDKFERKTITTRADYLYDSLPDNRLFFDKYQIGSSGDMFYYPNSEDDVIGEVEFQVISRSLVLNPPQALDAIYVNKERTEMPVAIKYSQSLKGAGCLNYRILSTRIPRLYDTEKFGIRWNWAAIQ